MNIIQQAVQRGLGSLRNPALAIQKLGIYRSISTPSYNPTTGAITSPGTTYPDIPMIFTSYKRIEIDGQAIRAEDQKVILANPDLPTVPTINDTITKADGSLWTVIAIATDPADAAWVLQIRKP
jgi:hypothetical protein